MRPMLLCMPVGVRRLLSTLPRLLLRLLMLLQLKVVSPERRPRLREVLIVRWFVLKFMERC